MASPDFLISWTPNIPLGPLLGLFNTPFVTAATGLTSLTVKHTSQRETYNLICPDLTTLSFPNFLNLVDSGTYTFDAPVLNSLSFASLATCNAVDSMGVSGVRILSASLPMRFFTTTIASLSLPSLVTVTDSDFSLSGLASLTSLDLSALQTVNGSFDVNGVGLLDLSLPLLTTVAGIFYFAGTTSLNTISIPLLASTGGELNGSNSTVTDFQAPSLTNVTGSFNFNSSGLVASILCPVLGNIGGDIDLSFCSACTTIDFQALVSAPGNLLFQGCNSLTSIDVSVLTGVGGILNGDGCPSLGSLSFPVATAFGSFSMASCGALAIISLPGDPTFAADFSAPDCGSLSQVIVTTGLTFTNGGTLNINFINCALDEATVDMILHSALVSGITGATIDLSGGTSAPPSVTGQADAAALVIAGNTVTTN